MRIRTVNVKASEIRVGDKIMHTSRLADGTTRDRISRVDSIDMRSDPSEIRNQNNQNLGPTKVSMRCTDLETFERVRVTRRLGHSVALIREPKTVTRTEARNDARRHILDAVVEWRKSGSDSINFGALVLDNDDSTTFGDLVDRLISR